MLSDSLHAEPGHRATGPLRETGFLLQTSLGQTAQQSSESCPVCGSSFLSPILCEIECLWFSSTRDQVSCIMFFWKAAYDKDV